jgi:ABC-2 type transport system ATP-binding protein
MSVLRIENIEKNYKDTILFSSFNLTIDQSEVKAVHSTLHIRQAIVEMFTGEALLAGQVYINGKHVTQAKEMQAEAGICFFDDGLYERLTVKDHFLFFKDLYGFNQTIDQIIKQTNLDEQRKTRVRELTYSEKKRIQYGRLLIQNPALFIFEEPDLNVDVETKQTLMKIITWLKENGKAALILTANMESAITLADEIYSLDERGLHPIDIGPEEEIEAESAAESEKEQAPFQFNKIPAKINDKMILFDPPEIDYIESNEGVSHIFIRGEVFPTMFTLNELEDRLRYFGFFRCHRSYIVNLQKVREVITWTRNSYSLILDDKASSSIPLSKTKMAELKEMLGLK